MEDKKIAVEVKELHKTFRLPLDSHSGIKQIVVNAAKRRKGYDIQNVLNGISFDIKEGEFFGIVGRNGSGKSTLLKLLAGIYIPDSGLVQVNGTLTPFIELGVGFNPELTGYENVFLNGALLGFSRKEMEAMYDDIVEFAELEKFMDQKIKNYSSGMQVRLAFSIAIRAQSDILLLDEVLAVGDEAFQRKCYEYFENLKANNTTVILVTHDMGAVEKFCDKAILISKGDIIKIGDPREIAEEYSMLNSPTTYVKKREASEDAENEPTNEPTKSDDSSFSKLIKSIDISSPNVKNDDNLTITVNMHNHFTKAKKVVCGINIFKIADPINSVHSEYNTYTELGDTIIAPGDTTKFVLTLEKGQLYKGKYSVKPHILDVDDDYKYHSSELHKEFSVKHANKSKSGSFNLLGNWRTGE